MTKGSWFSQVSVANKSGSWAVEQDTQNNMDPKEGPAATLQMLGRVGGGEFSQTAEKVECCFNKSDILHEFGQYLTGIYQIIEEPSFHMWLLSSLILQTETERQKLMGKFTPIIIVICSQYG